MTKTKTLSQKDLAIFAIVFAIAFTGVANASPYEREYDDDRYEYKKEYRYDDDRDDYDMGDDDRYEYKYKKYDDDKYEYKYKKYINKTDLPASAQTYLNNNYPNLSVIKAEKEYSKYKVKLANGAEIYFDLQGNVIKDEAKMGYKYKDSDSYKYMNPAEAPQFIKDYVATNYPNASIVKIENKYNRYEVKLSNGAEVKFNTNGDVIKKEYSDRYEDRYEYGHGVANTTQSRNEYKERERREYENSMQQNDTDDAQQDNTQEYVSSQNAGNGSAASVQNNATRPATYEQMSAIQKLLERLIELLSFWR